MYIPLLLALIFMINLKLHHTYRLNCPDTFPISHDKIQSGIQKFKYYTVAFSYSGGASPFPIGFIDSYGAPVKVIILQYDRDPGRFYVQSYFSVGKHCLKIYLTKYIVDDVYAIFESSDEYAGTWLQISEITYVDMESSSSCQDPLWPFLSEAITELKKKQISVSFQKTSQLVMEELFQLNDLSKSIISTLENDTEIIQFLAR